MALVRFTRELQRRLLLLCRSLFAVSFGFFALLLALVLGTGPISLGQYFAIWSNPASEGDIAFAPTLEERNGAPLLTIDRRNR